MIKVVSLITHSLATRKCDEEIVKDDFIARWIKTSCRIRPLMAFDMSHEQNTFGTLSHSNRLFLDTIGREIIHWHVIFFDLKRAGVKIVCAVLTLTASLPVSLLWDAWSFRMRNGLPYSSKAKLPMAAIVDGRKECDLWDFRRFTKSHGFSCSPENTNKLKEACCDQIYKIKVCQKITKCVH